MRLSKSLLTMASMVSMNWAVTESAQTWTDDYSVESSLASRYRFQTASTIGMVLQERPSKETHQGLGQLSPRRTAVVARLAVAVAGQKSRLRVLKLGKNGRIQSFRLSVK